MGPSRDPRQDLLGCGQLLVLPPPRPASGGLVPRSPAPPPCPYLFPAHAPRWVCLTGAAGHSSTIANRFSLSCAPRTPEGSSWRAEPGPEHSTAVESHAVSASFTPRCPPGPLTGQRIRHSQNGFPLQMRLFLKTAIAARARGPVVSSQWPLGTAVSPGSLWPGVLGTC